MLLSFVKKNPHRKPGNPFPRLLHKDWRKKRWSHRIEWLLIHRHLPADSDSLGVPRALPEDWERMCLGSTLNSL